MFWNEKVNDQRQDWRVWKAQTEIKAAIKNIWTYYSRSRQTVILSSIIRQRVAYYLQTAGSQGHHITSLLEQSMLISRNACVVLCSDV